MSGDATGRSALITGGAGFIGSHLAELLLADGWEVFVLDDLSTGSERNVAHLRDRRDFHLVVDSVLKSSVVNELVHRCDVVYHLAAAVGVRLIVEQPVHTLVTNIQGTETCSSTATASASACSSHRRPRSTATGASRRRSSEESRRQYGPTTARRWAYAESKALDEFLALAYHQERGLDCVIVRLFNTVGPRQSGQYGMVIPTFVSAALAGRPLEIHGDGTQTRCFCHVQDTIRALAGLMDAREIVGEIFNVGSTERSPSTGSPTACSRSPAQPRRSSASRTTRSTARESRTCSTASRRSTRSRRDRLAADAQPRRDPRGRAQAHPPRTDSRRRARRAALSG